VSDDEQGGGQGPPHEEVGSVAEEAAKLFSALQDWAKESGSAQATSATSAAAGLGARLSDVNEHLATGGADCTYCPVCQAIRVVRSTSPEVRAHLTTAASALLQAAAGLLETQVPNSGSSRGGVEKIDLDGSDESEARRWDAD
jgi:hypothetical protein